MARHNLGTKINENGTLEDLGNTISDEDLDYIDHTSNYLEWTKSRSISGTYTTIELFNVAPKSLSSKYFVSAEVTTNDGYDFTLIVYDGVAKITKDVDGKLYSTENINSMFSYPPQLGVYFGNDYVRAMFKTTGDWVKVKVSAIGCWEDDRSYVNIGTLYSGIHAGYTLPTWTSVANEKKLVSRDALQNLISKSGGTITGDLEVNGNLTKNGVNVVTKNDIDGFVEAEEYLPETPVGTPLDNYYSKTEYSNLDSVKFLNSEYENSLNVLGLVDTTYTVSGVTFTIKDGEITINGTANNDITWYTKLYQIIPAGEYSLNLIIVGGTYTGNSRFGLSINSWFGTFSATLTAPTITANLEANTMETLMYVNNGQIFNNLKIRPMMLKGNVIPTEFHQYNGVIMHQKNLSPVSITNSINFSKSSGNGTLVVQDAYISGNIVNLTVVCSCTAATSAGGDFWKGIMNYNIKNAIRGVGFASNKFVVLYIDKDGTSGVRAITDVSSGQSFTISTTIMI